jgi:hypothetical protein
MVASKEAYVDFKILVFLRNVFIVNICFWKFTVHIKTSWSAFTISFHITENYRRLKYVNTILRKVLDPCLIIPSPHFDYAILFLIEGQSLSGSHGRNVELCVGFNFGIYIQWSAKD